MEEKIRAHLRKRKRLLILLLSVSLLFYFLLPLSLIFIPDVMSRPSFFYNMPWAWLYAILQIPMTWVFVGIYHAFAKKMERTMPVNKEDAL